MHGSRWIAALWGLAACAALAAATPLRAQDVRPLAPPNVRPAAEGTPASLPPPSWREPIARPAETPAAAVEPARAGPPKPLSRGPQDSLPLKPPSRLAEGGAKTTSGLPSLVTVAASLLIVLGLFFALVWFLKRGNPKANAILPQEVVEILGRAPLDGRQQLHLLRVGRKLLLVSVTPAGAETLTEITEPLEVDRLAGLCMQARPNSATTAFRQVFQQFSDQRETGGDAFADGKEARRG